MNMTFWKTFFASLLASVVAGALILVIFFWILGGMIASVDGLFETKKLRVEENTVLKMELNEPIGDYTAVNLDRTTFQLSKQFGLTDILRGIEIAKSDDKIKGIFLNCDEVNAGMATVKEIRDALIDFQESGKFVVAYHENYSKRAYYLASAAKELYVYPSGMLDFLGLGAEVTFVKGALEKLDVEMQIIRGSNNKFKSAVEPLIYEQMSPENRKQTQRYLNAIWGEMTRSIASSRNMKVGYLNKIADSAFIRKSADAVDYKMADAVMYYDQIFDLLKEKSGAGEEDDLELLSFQKYTMKKTREERTLAKAERKNMAVIFAEGEIVDGMGEPNQIGGTSLSATIREAREDEAIKAVVLRVNSPGGSALASDIIWREVKETKKVKPVVVSMGDMAASGGYYISCIANKIFAEPTTITGSIGVFGIIPYTGDMFKNKLGITFDHVQTNEHAVLSMNKRLTAEELKLIQEGVDDIYNDFIGKVAEGRGMKKADVDSIGQGRVWAGTDAKKIGLIDEYGGLNDAIAYAADLVKISADSISIQYYPDGEQSELFQLIESFEEAGGEEEEAMINSALESQIMDIYAYLKTIGDQQQIQARMPYLLWIR